MLSYSLYIIIHAISIPKQKFTKAKIHICIFIEYRSGKMSAHVARRNGNPIWRDLPPLSTHKAPANIPLDDVVARKQGLPTIALLQNFEYVLHFYEQIRSYVYFIAAKKKALRNKNTAAVRLSVKIFLLVLRHFFVKREKLPPDFAYQQYTI